MTQDDSSACAIRVDPAHVSLKGWGTSALARSKHERENLRKFDYPTPIL